MSDLRRMRILGPDGRELPRRRARRCRGLDRKPGRRKELEDGGRNIDRVAARLNERIFDPLIHGPGPEGLIGEIPVLISVVEVCPAGGVEDVLAVTVSGGEEADQTLLIVH